MGKINKVIYERLSMDTYSEYEAGLNYFYQNAIGVNDSIDKDYIEYESNQLQMRNKVIGMAIREGNEHPYVRSTMIGLSSLSNNTILLAEI